MRILLLLFFISISHAQILTPSGITHGGEIEFTNDWIYEIDGPEKVGALRGREYPAAKSLAQVIKAKCRQYGCVVENTGGKWGPEFHVLMRDGWWFQISYDPLCVEIQTKPSTLQELYQRENVMEDLIFTSARQAGLKTLPNRSSHMNTGARSAFKYDLRSIFNFFVDNANNPELATGVFRNNWNTSPPLIASHENAGPIIESIQNRIEKRQIKSFAQLAVTIEEELHSTILNPQYNSKRNQDLTFRKLKSLRQRSWFSIFSEDDEPIERRAVRAVRSFHEFILHAELTEHRIAWIKKQPGFLTFINKRPEGLTGMDSVKYFNKWLREMNVEPARYQNLIKTPAPAAPKLKQNSCLMFYAN
ncbi:MAG: hypothetical protein JNM24_07245 [Bdellovibrionaceae bacterium]|nr:hypothetical protein [Pseudobdellovibrionaceae bacterium]